MYDVCEVREMKNSGVNKISLTEIAAARLADWVKEYQSTDRRTYLKLKYGIEVLFINITKMFAVYLTAYMLNLLTATIIFHISYCIIRKTAYGIHARTSIMCTLLSIMYFVGIPYLATSYSIPGPMILPIYLANGFILYLFAPSLTKKGVSMDYNKKRKLRNLSIVMCIVLMIITLLISDETTKTLITTGATLASVLTIQKNTI